MTFVRRYMSDRAHRLLTEDTAYCGKRITQGDRFKVVAKLGRCDSCEQAYENTPNPVREKIEAVGRNGDGRA